MICQVCLGLLNEQKKYHWYGTYDLQFDHHNDEKGLEESANANCVICLNLIEEVKKAQEQDSQRRDSVHQLSKYLGEIAFPLRAGLSFVRGWDGVYRLDFKPNKAQNGLGTFLLKQNDDEKDPKLNESSTNTTGSDEILETAKRWIGKCKCYTKENRDEGFLPPRLLDLRNLMASEADSSARNTETTQPGDHFVFLVSEEDVKKDGEAVEHRYVTLSHCWGRVEHLRLLKENIDELRQGIKTSRLPKTLQDAIDFASRLGNSVRYIWIDSLCITQNDKQDWLEQSAIMHKVYGNSFLNISATAARNSNEGMYMPRAPETLKEEKVEVKLDGIPGKGTTGRQVCRIIDANFWNREVLDAPVNKRGWVLQERLMAPRVLHFCSHQIAWECSGFEAAENRPVGLPSFQLKSGDIVREGTLKGLRPEKDGKRLRKARIGGGSDPDPHLLPEIYAYEIWKHVVEVYTTTALTKAEDRLIALSGIASRISEEIRSPYVAGMWRKHLESQLLWRVEPVFENGRFRYPSYRPREYRAPSFSWASVEVGDGQTLTYGETTDQDILIKVEEVRLTNEPPTSEFGLVNDGHLHLKGCLRKIQLKELDKTKTNRFGWCLVGAEHKKKNDDEYHINVYLDSPHDDAGIFEPDAETYCMPAAKGERTDPAWSRYLFCLLLQVVKGKEPGTYRRIGLAKLSAHLDKQAQRDVVKCPDDAGAVPHLAWDPETKHHTVRVI